MTCIKLFIPSKAIQPKLIKSYKKIKVQVLVVVVDIFCFKKFYTQQQQQENINLAKCCKVYFLLKKKE